MVSFPAGVLFSDIVELLGKALAASLFQYPKRSHIVPRISS